MISWWEALAGGNTLLGRRLRQGDTRGGLLPARLSLDPVPALIADVARWPSTSMQI